MWMLVHNLHVAPDLMDALTEALQTIEPPPTPAMASGGNALSFLGLGFGFRVWGEGFKECMVCGVLGCSVHIGCRA
jgi:hypothetical protein